MNIDPKKARSYREFLYILPFILLVLVFSYVPLYGWIYAFHDYQPPKPITASARVCCNKRSDWRMFLKVAQKHRGRLESFLEKPTPDREINVNSG